MNKLEEARKTWKGKSDQWLYERLANELTDKVSEIHRLLERIEQLNLCVVGVTFCDDCKKDKEDTIRLCKDCYLESIEE